MGGRRRGRRRLKRLPRRWGPGGKRARHAPPTPLSVGFHPFRYETIQHAPQGRRTLTATITTTFIIAVATVQSRLNSEDLRLARSRLQTEIDRLKLAAGNLRTVLDEKTELIARFLDECNELYVGTGPSGEYLLDICAQGNIECLENEQFGEHVTCCCGYHPATAYGEVISSQLIDGIASFDAPARVGRRLTGEERAAGSFWYGLLLSMSHHGTLGPCTQKQRQSS